MIVDPLWLMLAAAFFVIALVYASVGFGGGSSYTALMALVGVTTLWIPVLSLSCNLIVVAGGCWHFARRGHLNRRLIAPFLLTSVPASYLAATIPVDPDLYLSVLAVTLFAVAMVLLVRPRHADVTIRPCPLGARLATGCFLGGLSGLVGIGGGILLAPILLLARWASPRESAAAASVFILVNSIAGLAGQLSKPGTAEALSGLPLLAAAVLVGGQIGSRLGAGPLSTVRIRQATAVLVGLVAVRLFLQQI